MAHAVFSQPWLDQWGAAINADPALSERAPEGVWRIHMRADADGLSPYVPPGETMHLMIHLEDGRCTRLERTAQPPGPRDLDFRFTGSATTFEEIAAGLRDPIEAGLEGDIKIAGDMGFLLRHAELVQELVKVYTGELETDWPLGRPPYEAAA
jgi:hypothetical protein